MSLKRLENISVLIVEDLQELADMYSDQLEGLCDVRTAYTGEEAIGLLDESIDIVLLDRRLPDIPGDDVLDYIRTHDLDCRVAMVTGVDPDISLLDMPVDDYLVKPVTEEDLHRQVRRLADLDTYREPIREFSELASKQAVLEKEIGQERLAESEDYRERILQGVYEHELPPVLAELIDDYQEIEGSRSPFIWKWAHRLAPAYTLPFIEDRFREPVFIDKTLTILYITLLDDALEKLGNVATFWELAKLPRRRATVVTDDPEIDTDYVQFGQRVWDLISDRLQRGPNYDRYIELFHYDIRQVINAIEYTDLIMRQPEIMTMSDLKQYESHNMGMYAYADIDLMHTERDMRDYLSPLREGLWHAQQMARIGNWISTWERELKEGDISSGVVVYALDKGILDYSDLEDIGNTADGSVEALIDRIRAHDLERYFFQHWSDHYDKLESINRQFDTLDLSPFIEGTEEILRFHLASRGLK